MYNANIVVLLRLQWRVFDIVIIIIIIIIIGTGWGKTGELGNSIIGRKKHNWVRPICHPTHEA